MFHVFDNIMYLFGLKLIYVLYVIFVIITLLAVT